MTDSTRFPPQRGFAWRGDWAQRLQSLLSARGFSSVRAFAATAPTKSYVDLAHELGPGDVAAIQLQWAALDEARAAGEMEPLARDLLVRWLHGELPQGWTTSRVERAIVWPRANAISAWASSISAHLPEYNSVVSSLSRIILKENPFPLGWLPTNADDPLLVELFKRHWVEPR